MFGPIFQMIVFFNSMQKIWLINYYLTVISGRSEKGFNNIIRGVQVKNIVSSLQISHELICINQSFDLL